MDEQQLLLQEGRTLILKSLKEPLGNIELKGFATMLPAFSEEDRREAEAVAGDLVDAGCVEFCCVGPRAEEIHDAIDWIIEDRDALHIVTTWHEDESEACEYFIYAAAGRPRHLLGLVGDHPALASMLRRVACSTSS